jgi:hypothetical protein
MKKIFFSLLLALFFLSASAQRIYFDYLQSEQQQPFFVTINNKIHSSTASGYIILSRLRDSTYNMTVGFPADKWPEQRFSVTINRKDHGYLLKYFPAKGWGLFDLQDLSVQMAAVSNAGTSSVPTEIKDVSRFTDILSKAADDPSLKERPVAVNLDETKKDIAVQPPVKKEEEKTIVIETPKIETKPTETKIEEIKSVETKSEEFKEPIEVEYKPSVITKAAESSTAEGIGITFIDHYQPGKEDTIQILIPVQRSAIEPEKPEPKEQKRFLEISIDSNQAKPAEERIESKVNIEKTIPAATKPQIKNNFPGIAAESDYFKLRKKMASETNDYNMIDEARKIFKNKCFSVTQVKNLSSLFLTDLGKYMFFDAFYAFVSDPGNYPVLESELKDQYYINRFRAMLRD